ncbi:MAG: membrane protein insertion efficiency factor YidD [Candidatus Eisenbacteria bacterium]|nr:membrane protein insertion efficiency factor YidD [Candidatus Eisenbacteria bacterium]
MTKSILALLRLYRSAVAPFLPACCRFQPSCSRFAEEAVLTHGPWRGAMLAARRLLRCHPFGPHGYDPVPPARRSNRRDLLVESSLRNR